ncbi:MAG: sigma-70 family RNA polymerase sigma factor [Armatimonadetes bacterium]|nr:sigma-70 family RNA polymerase sigma factor [Armatimonadota bacterium]
MDFDGLLDSYEKPIYNLALRLLGDADEAADLTQDTFLAAYKAWDSFRGDSTAYTWLYRIAVNLCKNKFRERGRRQHFEGLSLDSGSDYNFDPSDTWKDRVKDASDTPDEALERKELKELIEEAIEQLPPDYRIVAVLRDLQGLSYAEIAVAADLSVDVVKTRLARARGMLRRRLGAYLTE